MQVPTDCGSPIQLIQRHDRAFPCHDWYFELVYADDCRFVGFADAHPPTVTARPQRSGYGWLQCRNLVLRGQWDADRLVTWECLRLEDSHLLVPLDPQSSTCFLPSEVRWQLGTDGGVSPADFEHGFVAKHVVDWSGLSVENRARTYEGRIQWVREADGRFRLLRMAQGRYTAIWQSPTSGEQWTVLYDGEWMGDRAHGLGTAVVECRSGDQTVQRMVRYEGMFHQHDKDMPGGRWMDRRPDTFESFQGVLDARGLPARGTLRTPLYWYEGDFHRGVRCGAGRQTIRVRDQTQEYDATVIAHWTSAPPACFGWLTLHRHPHHHTRYYGEMTADGLPDGRGTKLIDVPAHVEVQANMLASPLTLPCRLVQCGIFQQGLLADQARATIFYLTSRPPTWYVGPVMHAQPHGEEDGVLTCDGRQLYRGQWRHGRFHGRGKGVLRNQRGVDVLFDGVFVQGEAVQGATDRLVGSWTNGVGTLQFPPSVRIEYEGCTYAGGRYSGPVDREYPLADQSASMQFGPPLVDVDDESWMQIQSMLYRLSPNTRAQVETRLGGGGAVPSAIALDDSPETRLVTTLSWVQHLVDNQQPVQFVESSPIVTIYTTKLTIF